MLERKKTNLIWIIICLLAIAFGMITIQIHGLMKQQNQMINDLSQIEYLSSSTQRLTRIIITGDKDDKEIFYFNEEVTRILDSNSPTHLSLLENTQIKAIADEVMVNWKTLDDLFRLPINDEEASYDIDAIKLASDNHFNNITNLSLMITAETNKIVDKINQSQLGGYFILLLMVSCLAIFPLSTTTALRSSAELAAFASLDISTGLFNRSKCQELFKDTVPTNREQQPAIIVVDLNDLNKTNDLQGYRVGDDLIVAFSKLFQEAANIHSIKPFLGRYGGDEFVAYHTDIEKEDEVECFIKELRYLVDEFNKTEHKKFTISYAIGYAINKNGKDGLSARQLFDEAGENMYSNKRKIKIIEEQKKMENDLNFQS